MIDVRAGSGQELRNLNQSAKPALLEANFQIAFKSTQLFLGWAGLSGSGNIRVRDWDPPVRNRYIIKKIHSLLRIAVIMYILMLS